MIDSLFLTREVMLDTTNRVRYHWYLTRFGNLECNVHFRNLGLAPAENIWYIEIRGKQMHVGICYSQTNSYNTHLLAFIFKSIVVFFMMTL